MSAALGASSALKNLIPRILTQRRIALPRERHFRVARLVASCSATVHFRTPYADVNMQRQASVCILCLECLQDCEGRHIRKRCWRARAAHAEVSGVRIAMLPSPFTQAAGRSPILPWQSRLLPVIRQVCAHDTAVHDDVGLNQLAVLRRLIVLHVDTRAFRLRFI
jgi:hypothetical protein